MLCLGQFSVSVERPSVFTVTVEKAETLKADQLPQVLFFTFDGCAPCELVKADDKVTKFAPYFTLKPYDTVKQDPPVGITTVPAFRWTSPDGRTWTYPDPSWAENDPRRGYPGAERLIAMWRETQKPAMKATSELDQLTPEQRAIYDYWRGRWYSHEQIRRYAIRHNLLK